MNPFNIYSETNDVVYKSCGEWIVIMKKFPETVTNETRSGVKNRSYGKFRANLLFVVQIVNKIDSNKTIDSIQNTFYDEKITYVVDQEIFVENFDMDLDTVCSTGIHFFNTYAAAFFFEFDLIKNYSGQFYSWCDNGNVTCKGNYLNGKKSGLWIYYNDYGQLLSEYNYVNGKLSGLWFDWYLNGKKRLEQNYLNGVKMGPVMTWFHNGTKCCEGNYSNGKKVGLWTVWFTSGNKYYEGNYLNDKKVGLWIEWNEYGAKINEENYV
jgi:hypothetical protein